MAPVKPLHLYHICEGNEQRQSCMEIKRIISDANIENSLSGARTLQNFELQLWQSVIYNEQILVILQRYTNIIRIWIG